MGLPDGIRSLFSLSYAYDVSPFSYDADADGPVGSHRNRTGR
ncbi:hypothetical protein [Streptomyces sp. NPDC087300]